MKRFLNEEQKFQLTYLQNVKYWKLQISPFVSEMIFHCFPSMAYLERILSLGITNSTKGLHRAKYDTTSAYQEVVEQVHIKSKWDHSSLLDTVMCWRQ